MNEYNVKNKWNKYNVKNKCSKCGGFAATKYVSYLYPSGRMERVCERCGWLWYEEPLDAEEEQCVRRMKC